MPNVKDNIPVWHVYNSNLSDPIPRHKVKGQGQGHAKYEIPLNP